LVVAVRVVLMALLEQAVKTLFSHLLLLRAVVAVVATKQMV